MGVQSSVCNVVSSVYKASCDYISALEPSQSSSCTRGVSARHAACFPTRYARRRRERRQASSEERKGTKRNKRRTREAKQSGANRVEGRQRTHRAVVPFSCLPPLLDACSVHLPAGPLAPSTVVTPSPRRCPRFPGQSALAKSVRPAGQRGYGRSHRPLLPHPQQLAQTAAR